jgi:hypothetical protein
VTAPRIRPTTDDERTACSPADATAAPPGFEVSRITDRSYAVTLG